MLLLPFTRRLILVLLKQDDILHLLKCDILSKRPKTELPSDIFLQQIILKPGVRRNNVYATNITQYEDRFLFSEVSESNEMIGHNIVIFFLVFYDNLLLFSYYPMQIRSQGLKEKEKSFLVCVFTPIHKLQTLQNIFFFFHFMTVQKS